MLNFLTKIKKNRGFTLVELLVVITIIGILATILVVTVGDAIKRANDVERLAEVRQLAMILEGEVAIGTILPLQPPGACVANVATIACNNPGGVSVFPDIHDDGAKGITNAPVCVGGLTPSTAICHYGISNADGDGAPMTNDYQICFYLEIGVGGLDPGLNSIRTGAILRAGCN